MLLNILKGLFNRTAQVVQLPTLVSDDSRPMETRVIAGYAEIQAELGENSVSFWMNLQGMRDQVAVEAIKKGWTSYEAPLPQLIASWSSGLPLVFVDIGANSGYYSLLSAAFGARSVIAFEPAEEIANLLDANIKRSRFEQKIQVQRVVLSNKSGTSKVYYPESSHGLIETSASLNATFRPSHEKVVDVAVDTLDGFLGAVLKDDEKLLLKINVEGHDMAVLEGARRIVSEKRPGIIVELLPGIELSLFNKFIKDQAYVHFSLNNNGYLIKEPLSAKNINWPQRDHLLLPQESVDLWLRALQFNKLTAIPQQNNWKNSLEGRIHKSKSPKFRLIFFLAPFSVPFGGVATIVEHVRILVDNGISAWIAMSEQPAQDFYQTDVSTIIYNNSLDVTEHDICIFPEGLLGYMRVVKGSPARRLMLCQNYYYLPFTENPELGFDEYQLDGVIATCVANRAYLEDIYKLKDVPLIPYAIDTTVYHRKLKKIRQIAFMPRKLVGDIVFIRHNFLRMFPEYSDVPWIAIDKMPKHQVANVLAQSAIFLSLSDKDPLGLPPLEAMASGCVVAGFHGGGGLEYMTPANGWWADTGDWRACVNGLAAAVATFDRGGPALAAYHAETQRTVETYSVEGMTSALLSYWRSELARLPAQSVAATAS
jgi:FkbM family methyltransferase